MKESFACMVLILLVHLKLSAQEYETIKGGFISCDVLHYSYTYGEKEPRKIYRVCHKEYDREGRIILDEEFTEDSSSARKFTYLYDSAGNLAEEVFYRKDEDRTTDTYFYDEKGILIRTQYCNTLRCETDEYSYDEAGRVIEIISYDDEGKLSNIKEFTYDDRGRKIRSTTHDKKTEFTHFYLYEYDDSDNGMTAYTQYGQPSSKLLWYTELYDSSGRVFEHKDFNSDGKLERTEKYKFDMQGHEIEKYSDYFGLNCATISEQSVPLISEQSRPPISEQTVPPISEQSRPLLAP